jgi:hypothetical protein
MGGATGGAEALEASAAALALAELADCFGGISVSFNQVDTSTKILAR